MAAKVKKQIDDGAILATQAVFGMANCSVNLLHTSPNLSEAVLRAIGMVEDEYIKPTREDGRRSKLIAKAEKEVE